MKNFKQETQNISKMLNPKQEDTKKIQIPGKFKRGI